LPWASETSIEGSPASAFARSVALPASSRTRWSTTYRSTSAHSGVLIPAVCHRSPHGAEHCEGELPTLVERVLRPDSRDTARPREAGACPRRPRGPGRRLPNRVRYGARPGDTLSGT